MNQAHNRLMNMALENPLGSAPRAQSELEGVLSALEVEMKSLADAVGIFVERVAPVCRDLPTGEGCNEAKAHASSPIGGRIAAQIEQVRVLKHRVNTRIAELAI